jgi:hypothetical protein
MGDINRTLAIAQLQDNPAGQISIELNHGGPQAAGIVHLQTKTWRIELTEKEFIEFANAATKAGKRLRQQKNIPPGEPAT